MFDPSWIASPKSFFELAAIVARPDRALMAPETCGEWRLVYRLRRGDSVTLSAALPMTVNVIFNAVSVGEKNCRNALSAMSRPIKATTFARSPDRIEMNVFLAHWGQDITGHFLDQNHYLLAGFRREKGVFVADSLENAPDTERLRTDKTLQRRLIAWISDKKNLAAIAAGRQRLPREFLATRVVSVTPFGERRLANRPFSSVLSPDDFASLTLAAYPELQTPHGLLHRLDDATCTGCHQARAIAGFHLLGFERLADRAFDQLKDPLSAHFRAIQPWRERVRRALLDGSEPPSTPDPSRVDAHLDPILAAIGRDGEPCDHGELFSVAVPERDRWQESPTGICAEGECQITQQGFPGGMCSSACTRSSARSLCVVTPLRGAFGACVDGGQSFGQCLTKHGAKRTVPRCHENRECRTEYACLASEGEDGFCAPAYFLPQLSLPAR